MSKLIHQALQTIKDGVKTNAYLEVARATDYLRFQRHWRYCEIQTQLRNLGVDVELWEDALQRAEKIEGMMSR